MKQCVEDKIDIAEWNFFFIPVKNPTKTNDKMLKTKPIKKNAIDQRLLQKQI